VQVPYGEGVAIHIGPERAQNRPARAPAKRRQGVHRPAIERERPIIPGADTVRMWKAIRTGAPLASAWRPGVVTDPGMLQKLLVREPGRSHGRPAALVRCCSGPHREGEEPKPMMHDRGKSDSP